MYEGKQIFINLISMRDNDPMRSSRISLEDAAWNRISNSLAATERDGSVLVTVDHQGGNSDLSQIIPQVYTECLSLAIDNGAHGCRTHHVNGPADNAVGDAERGGEIKGIHIVI